MSPSATSPPVMQTAGRPPPYRVYDAAVSNDRTKPPGFSSRLPDAALIQLSVHAVCAALFLRVLGDCDEFLCGSL